MLQLTIKAEELFDEDTNEFIIQHEDVTIELEHSLVSVSKWEAIFEKPFLDGNEHSNEETIAYVECMNLTPNIPPAVFRNLSSENYEAINAYIDRKQSATWFNESTLEAKNNETLTSELIYYWMIGFNIPPQYENWFLNRLFTLIKVCNTKQSTPKKMSTAEMARHRREINLKRRSEQGHNG